MAGREAPHRDQGSPETEAAGRRLAEGVVAPRPVAHGVLFALLATIVTATPGATQDVIRPPIDQLVQELQTRYDAVLDFSATFEHRYSGGVISASIVEHGTVQIKKPGKMRWSYDTADEKLFVSDGETFYAYFPLDRQVIVAAIPSTDRASTPTMFLAGKGNLAEDFTASYESTTDAPGSWVIRLTPESETADYEWLTLTVDRTSLRITGLSTADHFGGRSTYYFADLQENQDLSDTLFDFTIPDNTDVITDDSFVR